MKIFLMLMALFISQNAFASLFDATQKLAKAGDVTAQFSLGLMYLKGEVVPENDANASYWFRMAANQGHNEAAFQAGVLYDEGKRIPQSNVKAVKWYRMAAEQGHAKAQYELGLMYRSGLGVIANAREAVKWYSKAAKKGQVNAQYNLAHMYFYGTGIPENHVRSYLWFSMAKTQGVREAATYTNKLRVLMTREQMAEAQALATQCHESNFKDCTKSLRNVADVKLKL